MTRKSTYDPELVGALSELLTAPSDDTNDLVNVTDALMLIAAAVRDLAAAVRENTREKESDS